MLDDLITEGENPRTRGLDRLTAAEIVEAMCAEDATVVAAVRAESEGVAAAIEVVAERLRGGGRLIYVGAGTSGRLGVLDDGEQAGHAARQTSGVGRIDRDRDDPGLEATEERADESDTGRVQEHGPVTDVAARSQCVGDGRDLAAKLGVAAHGRRPIDLTVFEESIRDLLPLASCPIIEDTDH